MKQPRWLTIAQWAFIGLIAVSSIYDAMTDHGVLMWINGVSMGFVLSSMLSSKFYFRELDRHRMVMNRQDRMLDEVMQKFGEAIESGVVRVIPMWPADDTTDNDDQTLH